MNTILNRRGLARLARKHPDPNWLATVLAAAAPGAGDQIVIPRDRWLELSQTAPVVHRPRLVPPKISPVARGSWPPWASAVALLRADPDVGVGDTIERWATRFGGKQFQMMAAAVGLPCRCAERQAEYNAKYPYCEA
jgi:hypothetical protein